MSYLILVFCILLLILLISWWKINSFVAFILVSFVAGFSKGLPVEKLVTAIEKGSGSILGSLLIILCFGAMQGKIVVESGAAQQITDTLTKIFGVKNLQWALLLTGFVVGIPLFYGVGFVLLAPLVINLSVQKKIPAVWLGMPMFAMLSALHGFLPPHPSPTALTQMLHGQIGNTLACGIVIVIISVFVAGVCYSKFLKKYTQVPMQVFVSERKKASELPSVFSSFLSCFLPIILIAAGTVANLGNERSSLFFDIFKTIGEPVTAMTISLLYAILILSRQGGSSFVETMRHLEKAVAEIAPVLLIVAGAGAMNQVLTDSGISADVMTGIGHLHCPLLLMGFIIATLIRVAVGSATIAGLTTAGIIQPLLAQSHVPPHLMVLSIGAGSLMFSHVNDSGFWMFKEYFNLTVKETFKTWTVVESLLGIIGISTVLIINFLFY